MHETPIIRSDTPTPRSGPPRTLSATVALVAALVLGCKESGAGADGPTPAAATTATSAATGQAVAHAAPGVEPGSHEDWCGAHQVPESMCTRCNPSLEAAFKATNDWCAEHGLPESQCRLCNPDLKIERPPRPGGKSP